MGALYQPRRALRIRFRSAWAAITAMGALAATACAGPAPAPEPRPELAPRRDTLAAFFSTFAIEPIGRTGQGRVLATRVSGEGASAVLIGPEPGRIEPALVGASGASRALATLDGDRLLIEVADSAGGGATTWVLAGPAAARRALGPPSGESWRLLGVAAGRAALFVAALPAGGGPELLLELGAAGERRATALAAPGLTLAAISADGRRAALVRAIDDRSHELYLLDRVAGETRLLLPDGEEGRFSPLAFSSDGQRLLLVADDASDLPRAEWLDLASHTRSPLGSDGCAALDARAGGDGSIALELACAGRSELRWLDLVSGAERALPEAPSGARPVSLLPEQPGAAPLWVVAGPRWPRDLWGPGADGVAEPLTYGLAPSIDPEDLVDAEALTLPSTDGGLAAELWRPRRAGGGPPPERGLPGVLWLESDARPPRWNEFVPLFQFLAERGVAVLRLRPRGADGFGRRFRALADGRQGDVELADVELARRALVERAGADPARLALVGEGPWPGALAAAAATRADAGFALVVAIDPDPDPLAGLDQAAAPESGATARTRARPDELVGSDLARRRALLRLGGAPTRAPLWLVIDGSTPRGAAARAALAAAATPVDSLDLAAPPFAAPRIDARLGAALAERLRSIYGARPAPTARTAPR